MLQHRVCQSISADLVRPCGCLIAAVRLASGTSTSSTCPAGSAGSDSAHVGHATDSHTPGSEPTEKPEHQELLHDMAATGVCRPVRHAGMRTFPDGRLPGHADRTSVAGQAVASSTYQQTKWNTFHTTAPSHVETAYSISAEAAQLAEFRQVSLPGRRQYAAGLLCTQVVAAVVCMPAVPYHNAMKQPCNLVYCRSQLCGWCCVPPCMFGTAGAECPGIVKLHSEGTRPCTS